MIMLHSATMLGCSCLAQGESAQIYNLQSNPVTGLPGFLHQRPPARIHTDATSPTATIRLLSASLHAYLVLQVLGYGLNPAFFGPWPWWALQLL